MNPAVRDWDRILWGACLLTAPVLFAASTFFWEKGEYGLAGGTLLILASVFWVPAYMGLFSLIKDKMPFYAAVGLLLAVYGCIGGVNFGMEGFYSAVFGISHDRSLEAFQEHPLAFNFVLFWPGPLFPLSLLVLGAVFLRKRIVPVWAALLICLAAIAFPLSRIPRVEWIAHLVDLLLLVSMGYIGLRFLSQNPLLHRENPEGI